MATHVSITVVMDPQAETELTGWGSPLGTAFRRLATATVYQAKLGVPHEYSKLGRLRESIKDNSMQRRSNSQGIWFEVGSDKPYANFIESGTGPHTIKPRSPEGQLVFYWRRVGRVVRMKSVKHPGNRAYRYLENGLSRAFAAWINTA